MRVQPLGVDALTGVPLCSLGSFQEGSGCALGNAFTISDVIQRVYFELHHFRWAEM